MGIFDQDFEGNTKIGTAVALLQALEPPIGYYGAFSGGKDSVVIKHLSHLAKVKVDWHYCVSPIDPHEIQQFIRSQYPDVQWDYHARGFWNLVVKKGLPRRSSRWCCEIIKEAGGKGRTVIVGNRRQESRTRSKQKCFEDYKGKVYVRPIINWTDGEVWEYIALNSLPFCSLYKEGFERLGCVLCPLARNTKKEILRFPKIANLWRLSCDRIVEYRLAKGLDSFETGEELWNWWLDKDAKPRNKLQGKLKLNTQ